MENSPFATLMSAARWLSAGALVLLTQRLSGQTNTYSGSWGYYSVGSGFGYWLRSDNAVGMYLDAQTGSLVFRQANNDQAMRLNNSGNLSVGTTSAPYRLTVEGPPNGLTFRGHAPGDFVFALAGDGQAGSNIDLFSVRNNNSEAVHVNTVNGARLALGVSTGSSAGSVVENLTIASTGNVGIGTATPNYRLTIETPSTGLAFRAHSAGDFVFALAGDGPVGLDRDLFSIRNSSTGVVHLNTVNSARLALGVSTGTGRGAPLSKSL